jgi:hypothetical protein
MDPTRDGAPHIADFATARGLITALQEQLASSQQEVVSRIRPMNAVLKARD